MENGAAPAGFLYGRASARYPVAPIAACECVGSGMISTMTTLGNNVEKVLGAMEGVLAAVARRPDLIDSTVREGAAGSRRRCRGLRDSVRELVRTRCSFA